MKATYFGTTSNELKANRLVDKISGTIHPKFRFPHTGSIELTENTLKLEGWEDLPLLGIGDVACEYDEAFNRFTVNSSDRLGFFGKGEPLIVTHGDRKMYLLIDWNFFTGFTDNRRWCEAIVKKVNDLVAPE
ncbi:hypothetical protein M1I95_04315 [Rossellomorea marisflavi]|uniref:hypothetical protein n=1 Tax=Rossellomorea marisflavi TaxID=189381 RepID=UPI0027A2BDE1|nr:hypothetical protein [Rossellomorea marisflavi]UTE73745.1 hypothetical protein M1I95_04315 [Rossellomorea marisflavi]